MGVRTKSAILVAMSMVGVWLCGCETQRPVDPYMITLNSQDQPIGRFCKVRNQGCLAMMKEPPRTCLIGSGYCNSTGSVQWVDPNTAAPFAPEQRLQNPLTIDAK